MKFLFLLACILVHRASSRSNFWSNALLPFNCISVHDYALDKSGCKPEQMPEQMCAKRCMDSASGCTGYHYSNGQCYPLVAGTNWHEKRLDKPISVCILRDNTACNPKVFTWAFERSRYYYAPHKKTWRDAAAHCESLGSKLLQIGSPQEQQFFINMLRHQKRKDSRFTMIGLMKLPQMVNKLREGWMWHGSGDCLDPAIRWNAGEPNNVNGWGQTIGSLFPDGLMDDGNHNYPMYYICECPLI